MLNRGLFVVLGDTNTALGIVCTDSIFELSDSSNTLDGRGDRLESFGDYAPFPLGDDDPGLL